MNERQLSGSEEARANDRKWVLVAPERLMTALSRVTGFLTGVAFEVLLASQFQEPTCISGRRQIDQGRLESNDLKLQPKLLQSRMIVGAWPERPMEQPIGL